MSLVLAAWARRAVLPALLLGAVLVLAGCAGTSTTSVGVRAGTYDPFYYDDFYRSGIYRHHRAWRPSYRLPSYRRPYSRRF